jgi:N-acetylmuramic acid 6-phosphate (MurNAc-6-P) etherase
VKVAIIMILTGKSESEAKESLEKANGFVKYAIQK